MKQITRLVDFILCTSIFTACCAAGLCMATERLVNGAAPPVFSPLHLFVFGSCMVVYNTPRIVKKPYGAERNTRRQRLKYLLFFCLGLAITVVAAFGMPVNLLVVSGLLSILAFGYFLPLLPFSQKRRLRDFGWVKIAVLAGVWTVSTSILPILYWQKSVFGYPYEVLLRLLFIFTLCVVFDIRDMHADKQNNIDTLPHKVGLDNSYRLINTTLLLFVIVSIAQYLRYPNTIRLAGAFLTAIVTKAVVIYLRKYPSERAYSGLADGMMIVYALLVLIP